MGFPHQTDPLPSMVPCPAMVIPLNLVNWIHWSNSNPSHALRSVGARIVPSTCEEQSNYEQHPSTVPARFTARIARQQIHTFDLHVVKTEDILKNKVYKSIWEEEGEQNWGLGPDPWNHGNILNGESN